MAAPPASSARKVKESWRDGELAWIDWELDDRRRTFLEFARKMIAIWRSQPVLKRRRFFHGRAIRGSGVPDVTWFSPTGKEMTEEEWSAGFLRCFGVRWAGDLMTDVDELGNRISGDTLFILFNAHYETVPFKVPSTSGDQEWDVLFDTVDPSLGGTVVPESIYPVQARSLVLLRTPAVAGEARDTLF